VSYIKAEDILPEEVIELIQQYVDGESIYIPRKAGKRLSWGCNTDYRAELRARNEAIRREHMQGADVRRLAQRYHLSEKSIRRILRGK
jgi:Mor family transcriptional regulator